MCYIHRMYEVCLLHQNTPLNPISRDIGLPDDANLIRGAPPSKHTNQNSVEHSKTTVAKHMWKTITKITPLHDKILQNPCQLLKWLNPLVIPFIICQVVESTFTSWETQKHRSNTNIGGSDNSPTSTQLSNHPRSLENSSWHHGTP